MEKYDILDIEMMREAINVSKLALDDDINNPKGGPFGSVICKNGRIVARGRNHVLANNDPSSHGEVFTIREACKNLNTWDLSGCVLYTNCEPCPMCLMTAKWANIDKIYFSATRKDAADIGFRDDDLYQLLKEGIYGIHIKECQDEAVKIMNDWYKKFCNTGNY